MNPLSYGHGYPPEAVKRAERVYIAAWRWRAAHHSTWSALVQDAASKAADGFPISVRRLTAGVAPQRFAPIMARWLASEYPSLLPHIDTRRSVFDVLTGATHGSA